MFKKKEVYKTTSKIEYAFRKGKAMKALAESYVIHDKHDRAVRAFRDVEMLMDKAWGLVYELYPKLKGSSIAHHTYDREIRRND